MIPPLRSSGGRRMQNFLLSDPGTPFVDGSFLSIQYMVEITRLLYSNCIVNLAIPKSSRCNPAPKAMTTVSERRLRS
jgi:hypothetical protein